MDPFIGEVRLFAGSYAPVDWLVCDGSTLRVSEQQALFAVIGYTYGGDGRTTFALPDLRGRLPVSAGQAPGLSAYQIGMAVGAGKVALTSVTFPSHSHGVNGTAGDGTSTSPANALYANAMNSNAVAYASPQASGAVLRDLDPLVLSQTGSNQAHANVMPTFGMIYIICTRGIFPQS